MDSEQSQLSLKNLMIAAPCDVEWDDMVGGDTMRRCNDCKLNVYHVENLTSKEVAALLKTDMAQSGNLCVRLYRRADGTLLTKDCPRGLAKVRALSARLYRTVAATLAAILAGSGVLAQDNATKPAGDKPKVVPHRLMGKICPPPGWKANAGVSPTKTDSGSGHQSLAPDQNKAQPTAQEDNHNSKAHSSALNLYKEGEHLEKSGEFAKAAEVYQQALTAMTKQKHDPKFHLKIETALSRVKAKAGINQ
jgi:hypothetical protein